MPIAFLVPNATPIDVNSNIASGLFTDIDETVAAADGALLTSVTNEWTNDVAAEILFPLTTLPVEATGINSITIRVRARIDRGITDADTTTYTLDVDTVMSGSVAFIQSDNTIGNKEQLLTGLPSVAQVNAMQIRAKQTAFTKTKGFDNLELNLDAIELEVDYVAADPNTAQLPSATLTLTPNVPQAAITDNQIAELPSAPLTLTPNVPQSITTEKHIAQLPSASLTLTPNVPQAVTTEGAAYEQEGFRFRNDDGTEITATWRQTQDVDDIVNKSTRIRLRVLTDATGDPPSITRTLQYKRDDEAATEWRDI